MKSRIFYRKEKLRGACWEYQIDGGWLPVGDAAVADPSDAAVSPCERSVLHHRFSFHRPREVEVHTCDGTRMLTRHGAEQWFFPDRWFSLLRFTTADDRTVGYYVNFSQPLSELRQNYYRDLDLELDLWLDLDGTMTELDRDEFEEAIRAKRLPPEWATAVATAEAQVTRAVSDAITESGPDLEQTRDPVSGVPGFILRA